MKTKRSRVQEEKREELGSGQEEDQCHLQMQD
jgi:hypothetical protein